MNLRQRLAENPLLQNPTMEKNSEHQSPRFAQNVRTAPAGAWRRSELATWTSARCILIGTADDQHATTHNYMAGETRLFCAR